MDDSPMVRMILHHHGVCSYCLSLSSLGLLAASTTVLSVALLILRRLVDRETQYFAELDGA